MKILVTFLCSVFAVASIAQKAPIKFGDVPMEDMKMDHYQPDSSAAAVVLTDFGESALKYNQNTGFSVQFERVMRIKILTKDGLDWATVSIPLYHEGSTDEKLTGLKASTFNLENGKIVETKLKSNATFTEKVNENVDLIKVTLPNVRQGSIVDVSYKVSSEFLFNFQDWDFQRTIPTRWSEYRTTVPEYFHYEKYLQGYVQLDVVESKQEMGKITLTSIDRSGTSYVTQSKASYDQIDFTEYHDRWAAKNVPAFKAEPFMTTEKDYISRLNFELSYQQFPNSPRKDFMGTWDDINKLYFESSQCGGEVNGNGFLKKIVEDITAGKTTPEEKIAAINNYVKANVEWNGLSYKFTDNSFRSVLEKKKGSSAEINLLLASMLDKAGIDVSPVLISTRDHGFVRIATPVSTQFNYVLCLARVGEKQILLDGTDPWLKTGVLPQRCLNGQGLIISKNAHGWVPLVTKEKSRAIYSADLMLTPDGEMKGKVQKESTGYFARESRNSYHVKGEPEYVKAVVGNRPWTVDKTEFANTKDVAVSFKEMFQVTITDHLSATGGVIYINPFVDMRETENPFKSEKREYPVDFGSPLEKTYQCKIAIPEGYVVDEVPGPRIIMLSGNSAKYTYSITQSPGLISLTSQLIINNSLVPQTEYTNLREFYNIVVAKQSEQIVLKKKN